MQTHDIKGHKIFVDVTAQFTAKGQIMPRQITWEDGRKFEIDRILDIRKAASLKGGGAGMRYLCRIQGKERYLWLDENRWFVEQACTKLLTVPKPAID